MPQTAQQVRKRQVFYIPGFDPQPPRRYRELYRREGAKQAEISGYELGLEPDPGRGWAVKARIEGGETHATIEVLEWSDIVRSSMDQTLGGTYIQLVRTAWTYFSTGAIWRLSQIGRGPILAAFYPVVGLLLQLFVALLAGWGLGWLIARTVGMPNWVIGAVALPVAWQILEYFRRHDRKVFLHYLMHDFAYAARDKGAFPPELEARIHQFADRVAEAVKTDADEVLVVGHSSGAALGVSVIAELVRRNIVGNGAVVSFLSLGQSIPMISFLPKADTLRRDLHLIAEDTGVAWVDVSAPGDGCSFALADATAVSGVAPDQQRWPLVISAAYTNTLSQETLLALRWRFFRKHFQYLCAFDHPKQYDYFKITAGPLTLADRYGGRNSSANRIGRAVSGYRTMAA